MLSNYTTITAVAGWFVQSSAPGDHGVSVIDGHVQGRYEPGVFENLATVKLGSRIEVRYGNGTLVAFKVVSVDSYSKTDAAHEQFRRLAGIERQLTLITCGGEYQKGEQSYEQRVVVRAERL